MPILKKDEALTERPVVICIYGEPGIRKTSVGQTSDMPLTIDFDRGIARSFNRQDTLVPNNWEEVLKEEQGGLYKAYKTIVIDTAKAALDDFLMNYVSRQDPKLKTNKLGAYGAIGDEFKRFVNARREEGTDIVIIAHAKKDEDTHKQIPDVTGQSYNLILRISDQVGFIASQYNAPAIQWTPTDVTVGKNTANLAATPIPDKGDPAFRDFMAVIIKDVKRAIVEMSEAQKEALEKSKRYQDELAKAESAEDLNLLIPAIQALRQKALTEPLFAVMRLRSAELGLVWDPQAKQFTGEAKNNATQTPAMQGEAVEQKPAQPAVKSKPAKNDANKATAPKGKTKTKLVPVGTEQAIFQGDAEFTGSDASQIPGDGIGG